MIRPQPRFGINKERVNRHSSQLGFRQAASSKAGTPRESDNELHNIRKTTFWMKKTIGSQGIQNWVPNQNPKPRSAHSRKVFSMKAKTNHEQTESEFNKNHEELEVKELNSKFVLIEKYQQEILEEITLISLEKVTRVSSCQNLFNSLNRVFSMISKSNLKQQYPSLDRIMMNHVNASSKIFEKIKSQSLQYIRAHKCEELISKIIQLEKQNKQILDRLICTEEQIRKIREETHKKKEMQFSVCPSFTLKSIDYERVYAANCSNFSHLTTGIGKKQKSVEICDKMMRVALSQSISPGCQYLAINSMLTAFLLNKQNFMVFKKFVDQLRLRNKTQSLHNQCQTAKQSLPEQLAFETLQFRFDFHMFSKLKQNAKNYYLNRMASKAQKVPLTFNLLEVIIMLNSFTVIKCKDKKKEILISLFRRVRTADGDWLKQQTLEDLSLYIAEEIIEVSSNKQGLAPELKQVDKQMAKMKSKRLVNCISLFQGKANGREKLGRNSEELAKDKNQRYFNLNKENKGSKGEELQKGTDKPDQRKNQHKVLKMIEVENTQFYLLLYKFVRQQFEYATKAMISLLGIKFVSEETIATHILHQNMRSETLSTIIEQSLKKLFLKELYLVFTKFGEEIKAIADICEKLASFYGCSKLVMGETKENLSEEIIGLLKMGIIDNLAPAIYSPQKSVFE